MLLHVLLPTCRATQDSLCVRFLGTGAADWLGPEPDGEYRRTTSVLLDGVVLIDFNACNADMLPPGRHPEVVFYTHSHDDHYNAEAALELGVHRVYVSETWADRCREDFVKASAKSGKPVPDIIALGIGRAIEDSGLKLTALPANHATGHIDEQCLIYLVEKGDVRLLYATDTGGIMAVAARLAGIDAHIRGGKPIDALIIEATMGADYDEDYRIFTHSSVDCILRIVHVLQQTGRLAPSDLSGPSGQTVSPVYLTHLARTLHPSQSALDQILPAPLHAAYDGLEVVFTK